MKLYRIIFLNEYKLLFRSKLQLIALLLFTLLGIYSIYYGNAEVTRQKEKISQVADSIIRAQRHYQEGLKADTTKPKGKYVYENATFPSIVRFSYNFFVANHPSPLAALSLGQRDLYLYYYVLNAQNLYTQTMKGDISNPFKLSAGNFDLAFVLVYLLPLLIIALSFDILSDEKDLGTYTMLRTSTFSIRSIVAAKLCFRFLMVFVLISGLSGAGCCVAGIQTGNYWPAFLWVGLLTIYAIVWFSITFFINSFKMNTPFNAVSAIGVWIVLLIVIPSLINIVAEDSERVNATGLAGLMRSRNMAETDEAMYKALYTFYFYHPELKPRDTVKTAFFYFQGYSAFLAVDQRRSKSLVDHFYQEVKKRNRTVQYFNAISPAVNVQNMLDVLAKSDLDTELDFKAAIEQYHQQIFWFSNTPLFKNRMMNNDDYNRQPDFSFQPQIRFIHKLGPGLIELLLLSFCLLWFASKNLSESNLYN